MNTNNENGTDIRCCGACRHFQYEEVDGWGICDLVNDSVPCDFECEAGFEEKKEPKIISVYLSGKVSGLDLDVAKERFADAARQCETAMKEKGYDEVYVVNPLAIPTLSDLEWADYMLMDLQLLRHCDAIMMLPGWEESQGAVVEHGFSVGSGKAVYYMV